jgi:hypothetical protein
MNEEEMLKLMAMNGQPVSTAALTVDWKVDQQGTASILGADVSDELTKMLAAEISKEIDKALLGAIAKKAAGEETVRDVKVRLAKEVQGFEILYLFQFHVDDNGLGRTHLLRAPEKWFDKGQRGSSCQVGKRVIEIDLQGSAIVLSPKEARELYVALVDAGCTEMATA